MIFGLRELRARRTALVERCAAGRAAIVAAGTPIAARAATIDRLVGSVRAHPVVATLVGGAVAGLLPRLLPAWAARVLVLYSLLRKK